MCETNESITNDLKCEVCGGKAISVCAMPGVPASFAYCQECLNANAHPYGIVVRQTAMLGGLKNAAPEWHELVHSTLTRLGKTQEQFDADLAADMKELDAFAARQDAIQKAEDGLEHLFTYHPPKDASQVQQYTDIREAGHQFALTILRNTPAGADQSAAIRKVREAVMTANAAIACGEPNE